MSYNKEALMRECRENGLEPEQPERYSKTPDTLQWQLGRHYYQLDHASMADVPKSKVGDTVRVSDYPYGGYATAKVIEVHRTDEGFVYKIKVKRTGQAEKEELVREDALNHNVNYDNMRNFQQYYLDYHKRKEQEALVELVKAKDEQPKANGLNDFLKRFGLRDQFDANEEGNIAFLVPKSSSFPYHRIYIYSNRIALQRSIAEVAEVKFYNSKEELAALLRETSEEALQLLFEKVNAAALSLPDDDVSEAGYMLKVCLFRAIQCYGGSRDVDGAMRALKEAEKFV